MVNIHITVCWNLMLCSLVGIISEGIVSSIFREEERLRQHIPLEHWCMFTKLKYHIQKDMGKYFHNKYENRVSYEEMLLFMDQVSWSQDSSVSLLARLGLAGPREFSLLLNVQASSAA